MAGSKGNGILSMRFNQDQGCFTCSMETGLRIFNVEPLAELEHYDGETVGSVGIAEMLWRTNVFAIVGGGSRPKFAENTVLIYNDHNKKFIGEITFMQPIKAVRLRRDKLIVGLDKEIYVYSFPFPYTRLLTLQTSYNPKGLMEIASNATAHKQLLAFPGHKIGSLQLLDLTATDTGASSSPATIHAHQNELACIAVNTIGTKVATASVKGTLIRIWDALRKTKLIEIRRGTDPATIYCINFSRDSEFLCLSSDKGTVHIFALKDINLNKTSQLSSMEFLVNYTGSKWALATFPVPPECACICAFGAKNSVIAICADGTFHKYMFTLDGKCHREAYDVFFDICADDEY